MAASRVILAVGLVIALFAVGALVYINLQGIRISNPVGQVNNSSKQNSGGTNSSSVNTIQVATVVSNSTMYLSTTLAQCQDHTGSNQAYVTTTTTLGGGSCYLPPNQGSGGAYPTWTVGFNVGVSGLSATWHVNSSGNIKFQVYQCANSGCQTLYSATNSPNGSYAYSQANLTVNGNYQVSITNFSGQNEVITGSIVITD